MKELQPLNEHVLLDISEEAKEEKTPSGIIIPDSAKEKKKMAKVVAVSDIENSAIEVGDTVMYKEFSGTEAEVDGKKYLLIPYADILAKVVETDKI
ncbi:MAG: co-chaperone GroES [Bacteroidales bacterium]